MASRNIEDIVLIAFTCHPLISALKLALFLKVSEALVACEVFQVNASTGTLVEFTKRLSRLVSLAAVVLLLLPKSALLTTLVLTDTVTFVVFSGTSGETDRDTTFPETEIAVAEPFETSAKPARSTEVGSISLSKVTVTTPVLPLPTIEVGIGLTVINALTSAIVCTPDKVALSIMEFNALRRDEAKALPAASTTPIFA